MDTALDKLHAIERIGKTFYLARFVQGTNAKTIMPMWVSIDRETYEKILKEEKQYIATQVVSEEWAITIFDLAAQIEKVPTAWETNEELKYQELLARDIEITYLDATIYSQ